MTMHGSSTFFAISPRSCSFSAERMRVRTTLPCGQRNDPAVCSRPIPERLVNLRRQKPEQADRDDDDQYDQKPKALAHPLTWYTVLANQWDMVARPTNARPASAAKCAVRLQPELNARTTATMGANKEKRSERSSLRQGRTCREKEGNYVEGFHTLPDDRPRNRGADPRRPRSGEDGSLPLLRRGRGAAGSQPSRHSDDRPTRVRARHREDCEHARLQPIRGQDTGVLLRRERRHLSTWPARAAGKPRRTGNRAAARTELRPHRGHSARA